MMSEPMTTMATSSLLILLRAEGEVDGGGWGRGGKG